MLFANVAGELVCQWTEKDDLDKAYSPGSNLESVQEKIECSEKPIGECGTGGLFERFKVVDDNTATEGKKAFLNVEPLPRAEVEALDTDKEGVVMCPHHEADQVLPDCVYCHARLQNLVARAEESVRRYPVIVTLENIRTTEEKAPERPELVFSLLTSAKQIPLRPWKSQKGSIYHTPVTVGLEAVSYTHLTLPTN